jgi:hypothetical protein
MQLAGYALVAVVAAECVQRRQIGLCLDGQIETHWIPARRAARRRALFGRCGLYIHSNITHAASRSYIDVGQPAADDRHQRDSMNFSFGAPPGKGLRHTAH